MEIFKDKNKRSGLITTIVIHVLLLILFLFTGLIVPVPIPEQGILINFGTTDEGVGDVQPEEMNTSESEEVVEEQEVEAVPQPTEIVEEVITQDDVEAPEITKTEPVNVETEVVEEIEPEPVVNPAAMYTGKKNTEAAESYEGETGNPGDQGSTDGSKESNVHGNSTGNAKSGFFLAGRSIVNRYVPKDRTQETGKVVVIIWVNRYGKVTRATPGSKGSTTTNAQLYKIAKDAALKTVFSSNTRAAEEQKGTIEYIFKVRQ